MAETSIRRFYGTETDRINANSEDLRIGDTFQVNGGQYRFYVWLGEKWMLLNSPLEKSLEKQRTVTWSGISTDNTQIELFLDGVEGNRLGILPNQIVYFKIDFVPILETGAISDIFRTDTYVKNDINGLGFAFDGNTGGEYEPILGVRFPDYGGYYSDFGWNFEGTDNPDYDINNWGEGGAHLYINDPEISLDIENSAIILKVASIAGDYMPPDGTLFPMTWKVTGYLTTLTI